MFLPENESSDPVKPEEHDDFAFDERESDEEEPRGWVDGDPVNKDGTPVFEHSLSNTLINADVLLPQGEELAKCKVKGRHVGPNGEVTGQFHKNPLLNSIVYDVEFPDGAIQEYTLQTLLRRTCTPLLMRMVIFDRFLIALKIILRIIEQYL